MTMPAVDKPGFGSNGGFTDGKRASNGSVCPAQRPCANPMDNRLASDRGRS